MESIESKKYFEISYNNYVVIFLVVFIGLYYMSNHSYFYESKLFKLLLFLLLIYVSAINIVAGIILALVVLVLSQNIISCNIMNETENFEQYLNNPLIKDKDLERLGKSMDLKLETPNEKYIKMMQDGKKMVDKSYVLYNDAIKNNDDILKNIANDTYVKGSTLIQSGINQTQENSNQSENNKIHHVVYENLLHNYTDNKQVMDSYKNLIDEYSENQNIVYENYNDFETKLNHLYKKQFNLLKEINNDNKTKKNKTNINTQINKINSLIDDKKNNKYIETQLTMLTEMLF